ncbi:anaerobic ribonucleoside-triphosphate reductase activating protein [Candidatus Woesearchaeota archaeon CG10_big_fil_rev_8_21_14_0_10_34_12]|nr:MAG: anaerobic ribonucleoside-triphosphate reductase activating protein [Candidatus Woesearchaeota archaeon CG10_big_fil_rev_8_21_14_0_10_34_12]
MSVYENIRGFIPNSLVDWDGKVSAVVFLGNCNFRCGYCHNRELVLEPEKIKAIAFDEIKSYLDKNMDFVDGIVVTGGEPTLYPDLKGLLSEFRKMGLKIKLETNGSNPKMLKELIDGGLVDFIAMDIKTSFDKYKEIVGVDVDIEKIKESIALIKTLSAYEFRITLFPEIKEEDLENVFKYLAEEKVGNVFLQQFRAENCIDGKADEVKPYSKEEISRFLELARKYICSVGVRNI